MERVEQHTDLGDGLELRPDGFVYRPDGNKAKKADVPKRKKGKRAHWLDDLEAVKVVPAGWPDCTIDDDGRLVPLTKPGTVPTVEVERDL